ncbi:hypothetical protein D3C87_1736230 [compost metagenome]
MIGRTIAPIDAELPEKIAFAIGTPDASDFFEPQKVMVISSSLLKPSSLLPNMVMQSTAASRTISRPMTTAISVSEKVFQMPSITAVEKAR